MPEGVLLKASFKKNSSNMTLFEKGWSVMKYAQLLMANGSRLQGSSAAGPPRSGSCSLLGLSLAGPYLMAPRSKHMRDNCSFKAWLL